jgi:CheY-like chemotaxis protein
METLTILIIEDDEAQIQIYEDVIEQYNKNSEPKIEFEICQDFNQGQKALETPFYDAAIIDLKLSNTEELEGKKLVEAVHGKIRIPIVIYSGSISQIDDIPETVLLKKKLRTENLTEILNEIIAIYNTGITQLLRPAGEIDQKLTNIFWNHLADNLNIWMDHNNPKTLLRHVFTHFQEHMEIDTDGNFEEYHPAEIYLSPPIKANIHTGDLIKIGDEHFIVLTPACDVVFNYRFNEKGERIPFRKADHLVVAQAKEFDFKTLCLNKKGDDVDKGKINDYVSNSYFRFHYLPSFKGNNGFLIDFQELKTVAFDAEMDRVATVSGAFSKDIVSRFSLYFARQGQPTFHQKKIVNELFAKKDAK